MAEACLYEVVQRAPASRRKALLARGAVLCSAGLLIALVAVLISRGGEGEAASDRPSALFGWSTSFDDGKGGQGEQHGVTQTISLCDPDSPNCNFNVPTSGLYAHGTWSHNDAKLQQQPPVPQPAGAPAAPATPAAVGQAQATPSAPQPQVKEYEAPIAGVPLETPAVGEPLYWRKPVAEGGVATTSADASLATPPPGEPLYWRKPIDGREQQVAAETPAAVAPVATPPLVQPTPPAVEPTPPTVQPTPPAVEPVPEEVATPAVVAPEEPAEETPAAVEPAAEETPAAVEEEKEEEVVEEERREEEVEKEEEKKQEEEEWEQHEEQPKPVAEKHGLEWFRGATKPKEVVKLHVDSAGLKTLGDTLGKKLDSLHALLASQLEADRKKRKHHDGVVNIIDSTFSGSSINIAADKSKICANAKDCPEPAPPAAPAIAPPPIPPSPLHEVRGAVVAPPPTSTPLPSSPVAPPAPPARPLPVQQYDEVNACTVVEGCTTVRVPIRTAPAAGSGT